MTVRRQRLGGNFRRRIADGNHRDAVGLLAVAVRDPQRCVIHTGKAVGVNLVSTDHLTSVENAVTVKVPLETLDGAVGLELGYEANRQRRVARVRHGLRRRHQSNGRFDAESRRGGRGVAGAIADAGDQRVWAVTERGRVNCVAFGNREESGRVRAIYADGQTGRIYP